MKRQKAFYTLEATWMFGLALVIFIGIILLVMRLYVETADEIKERPPAQIEAVEEFRKAQMARDLAGQIKSVGK